MIPHVHIYFITFHNKCLYNYSYPHAASKAHFNANPTTYIYITKVSLTEKYYSCLLVLKLDSAAWITCTRPLSEVRFPSVFVSQKPSRTDSPVSKEAAWNGSQLLWTVFFAFYGADSTVHLIWTAGSSHLQLLIVCVEYTCLCIHSHTHLSDLKKCLCVFYWLLHRLLNSLQKLKFHFFIPFSPPILVYRNGSASACWWTASVLMLICHIL